MKSEDILERARYILSTYDLDNLQAVGLHQDLAKYCFSATYPPLKALPYGVKDNPFLPTLPEILKLYFHFPICSGKCTFCHFNVLANPQKSLIEEYLQALHKEISFLEPYQNSSQASSIYFGGGTPSLMTPTQIRELLQSTEKSIGILPQAPVTLEIHPEIIESNTEVYLSELKSIGINRVSIGVQDFDPRVLNATNRRHSPEQAEKTIMLAQRLGLAVNIDLLMPLPYQTIQSWIANLSQSFSLQPESVTLYTTSIRDSMPLAKQIQAGVPVPDQESVYLFYILAQLVAEEMGYTENQSRWFERKSTATSTDGLNLHEPVVGLGCGAYGYVNDFQYFNTSNMSNYMQQISRHELPLWRSLKLTRRERLHRELIFSARSGIINLNKFLIHFDCRVEEEFADKLIILEKLKLAVRENRAVMLTPKGKMLSDEIAKFFISPEMETALSRLDLKTDPQKSTIEHLNHFYEIG